MKITRSWMFLFSTFIGSACLFATAAGFIEDRVVRSHLCDVRAELVAKAANPPPDSFL
jgi:hypothetical protein